MAYQIKATHDSNTKPNYVGALEATPAFADGEFGVFFAEGSNGREVSLNAAILKCIQALRERGWPNPAVATFNTAVYNLDTTSLSVTLGAAIPAPVNGDVMLIQGSGFTVSHDSNSAHGRRLIEAALERYLGGTAFNPRDYSLQLLFDIPAGNLDLTIPATSGLTYDMRVDFGDGSPVVEITDPDDVPARTHTYAGAGQYLVEIWGLAPHLPFGTLVLGTPGSGDDRIIELQRWGYQGMTDATGMFCLAENMVITAQDYPILTGCTSIQGMMAECPAANPDVSQWDVSNIQNFGIAFLCQTGTSVFTGVGLDQWDVTNGTNFIQMFDSCDVLDADLSGWRLPNATDITYMFRNCPLINFDAFQWGISNLCTLLVGTFQNCALFDSDLGVWDTSSVTLMSDCFNGAAAFQGTGVDKWNIQAVIQRNLLDDGLTRFGTGSGITTANYGLILDAWSLQVVDDGMDFGMGTIQYPAASQASRDILTNAPNNWTITDGGVAP